MSEFKKIGILLMIFFGSWVFFVQPMFVIMSLNHLGVEIKFSYDSWGSILFLESLVIIIIAIGTRLGSK